MIATELKGRWVTTDPRLDRVPSAVYTHFQKYPLTAESMPDTPVPVVAGVNWYPGLSQPRLRTIRGVLRYVLDPERATIVGEV